MYKLPLTVLIAAAVLSTGSSFAADVTTEIKNCARTEDSSIRAACYEALGKAVLAAESAGDQAPTAAADLPTDLGGGTFKRQSQVETGPSQGLVSSCRKGGDGKWLYFFEQGQVWKQVGNERRGHKQCNFNAMITKDVFGYKIKIEGEKRQMRVRRIR